MTASFSARSDDKRGRKLEGNMDNQLARNEHGGPLTGPCTSVCGHRKDNCLRGGEVASAFRGPWESH